MDKLVSQPSNVSVTHQLSTPLTKQLVTQYHFVGGGLNYWEGGGFKIQVRFFLHR